MQTASGERWESNVGKERRIQLRAIIHHPLWATAAMGGAARAREGALRCVLRLGAMFLLSCVAANGCAGTGAARSTGGLWAECSWSGAEHYPGQRPCTFNSQEEYQLARLWPALGYSLAAQNAAREEHALPAGSTQSSCENYLQSRPVAAEAFRRSFGSTGACWKNGPALAQQCLSFCLELAGRSQSSPADAAAQEAKAVQVVDRCAGGLREREAAAVAALQPTARREAGGDSSEPVEPPVELSDKCRRYVREFPARPESFLAIFGSKGACWRASPVTVGLCNSTCGELLIQAAKPLELAQAVRSGALACRPVLHP